MEKYVLSQKKGLQKRGFWRLSQQIIFLRKLVSKLYLHIGIFEISFLFYGQS